MSIIKRPLNPRRLRKAPPHGFGWIDHRLLKGGCPARPGAPALGLYCLLVCAADRQGLSYYSEERLCALLSLDAPSLRSARRALIDADLIAYARPLYQVLAIDPQGPSARPAPVTRRPETTPPPPQPPPPQPRPLAPGLNLRAMVEASLRQGGVL